MKNNKHVQHWNWFFNSNSVSLSFEAVAVVLWLFHDGRLLLVVISDYLPGWIVFMEIDGEDIPDWLDAPETVNIEIDLPRKLQPLLGLSAAVIPIKQINRCIWLLRTCYDSQP